MGRINIRWEPRLLPATIAVLALLLAVKSTVLVRALWIAGEAVGTTVLPRAQAALHETEKKLDGHDPDRPDKAPGKPDHAKPAETRPVAAAVPPPPMKPEPQEPPEPPVSDSERAILLDLRQRRVELDGREAALAGREAMLSGTDRKLTTRIEELQLLQKKLEALNAARSEREDAGWQGLVKIYQSMKPRDAATILNDLDMAVLLPVMDRMKEAKAAPILSAMLPEKAREITDGLAKLRTRPMSAAPSGTGSELGNGG